MSQSEPTFTEMEERHLLAEIIKTSTIPPLMLLSIVRDTQTEVQWPELALPYGRSLSACQRAFASMQARITAADPQSAYYRRFSLGSSDLDRANAAGRELIPRPPSFTPIPGGPSLLSNPSELPPRKKRGRPNKEEFQRRLAEAQARGEEYPKRRPKSAKTMSGQAKHKTSGSQSGRPTAAAGSSDMFSEAELSPTGPPPSVAPFGGISMDSLLLPMSPVMPLPPSEASPTSSGRLSRAGYSVGVSSPEAPSRPAPSYYGQGQQSGGSAGRPSSGGSVVGSAAGQQEASSSSSQRPSVSGGPSIPQSQASIFSPANNPYGV